MFEISCFFGSLLRGSYLYFRHKSSRRTIPLFLQTISRSSPIGDAKTQYSHFLGRVLSNIFFIFYHRLHFTTHYINSSSIFLFSRVFDREITKIIPKTSNETPNEAPETKGLKLKFTPFEKTGISRGIILSVM